MRVVFCAEDEPAATRVDRLRAAIENTVMPCDHRPTVPAAQVRDRIAVSEIGLVRVVAVTTAPGVGMRTPRLVRRHDAGLCRIDLVTSGELQVEQDGRRARLGPGDFAFADLSRPLRSRMDVSLERVSVVFPRSSLPLPRDETARLTAVRFAGDHGAGALVSSLASALPAHEDDGASGIRLGTAVIDLVAAALAERSGSDLPGDAAQRALLLRIRAFVEARLGDPELTPATIATAHHLSLRYLYNLFATQGVTVGAWIRQRRLDRARRDLLDPALSRRPVSAIGAQWGMTDAAHFSRLFRAAYGAPPSEYRRQHLRAGDGVTAK